LEYAARHCGCHVTHVARVRAKIVPAWSTLQDIGAPECIPAEPQSAESRVQQNKSKHACADGEKSTSDILHGQLKT